MPVQVTSDRAAWQEIQSKLMATGWCSRVLIGEPKAAPDPITACILGDEVTIDETTLNTPREVHKCIIRFYAPFLGEPEEEVEFALEQIRANIWSDIFGDFELGGDIAYIMPTLCASKMGNLSVGGRDGNVMYRILDMTIAYRVDDKATFVA